MKHLVSSLLLATLGSALAPPATAAPLPCAPCAGVSVDDPFATLAALGAPPALADDALLVVAYDLEHLLYTKTLSIKFSRKTGS